jgi:hypothetical protein
LRINPPKKYSGRRLEAAFRTGGIDNQFGCIDTLKRELHGTAKQSDQLLAKDLPVLNESLKARGQQLIEAPRAKVADNEKACGPGG